MKDTTKLTYARYRAVYTVHDEQLADGGVLVNVRIHFVAVGQRKERDKRDIYKLAEKIVETGIIELDPGDESDSSPPEPG